MGVIFFPRLSIILTKFIKAIGCIVENKKNKLVILCYYKLKGQLMKKTSSQAQKDKIADDFKEYLDDVTSNELTQDEEDEIVEHFKVWSGGFTPDECPHVGFDEPTHESYVEYALNKKFAGREEIVTDFLCDYEQ